MKVAVISYILICKFIWDGPRPIVASMWLRNWLKVISIEEMSSSTFLCSHTNLRFTLVFYRVNTNFRTFDWMARWWWMWGWDQSLLLSFLQWICTSPIYVSQISSLVSCKTKVVLEFLQWIYVPPIHHHRITDLCRPNQLLSFLQNIVSS